jgi:hypothetical protein
MALRARLSDRGNVRHGITTKAGVFRFPRLSLSPFLRRINALPRYLSGGQNPCGA